MKHLSKLFALLLSVTLFTALLPSAAAAPRDFGIAKLYQEDSICEPEFETPLPLAFVQAAGVMTGDQAGNLNWDSTLTRAEAAAMLTRLMGAEEEAKALKGAATPFVDVPAWATGYVNYAFQNGVIKGVDATHFGPERLCSAAEFLTMLFRLTNLTEGTDYRWNTAVEDAATAIQDVADRQIELRYFPRNRSEIFKNDLTPPFHTIFALSLRECAFTRQLAAATIFRMLNISAGPHSESLADILAADYGMDDLLFYDYNIRRTAYELSRETTWTMGGLTGAGSKTVLTLEGGKLHVNDSTGATVTLYSLSEPSSSGTPISNGGSCSLPLKDADYALDYQQFTGESSTFVRRFFSVTYRNGAHGFALPSGGNDEPYDYYYTLADNAYFERIRAISAAYEAKFPGILEGYITDEMRTLAASLTARKATERDKAEAISQWVASHIFYDFDDYEGRSNESQLPADVLSTRRAVCEGYARLTRALMRAAGLECYYASSTTANHAWNAAYLDGEWVLLDNTYDGTSVLQYRNKAYYVCDPSRSSAPEEERLTPVADMREPGVVTPLRYFGMDPMEFLRKHPLDRTANHTDHYRNEMYHFQ